MKQSAFGLYRVRFVFILCAQADILVIVEEIVKLKGYCS